MSQGVGRNNLDEMLMVLEEIRAEKYPDIPAEVVRKIAESQFSNQDNRRSARDLTRMAVMDYINSMDS